jgi:YesN/AraC family two-component response regulator
MKVLIADDDMVLRQGLSIYIEENIPFCKVVGNVSNGKEALDFIKEKRFFLLLGYIIFRSTHIGNIQKQRHALNIIKT